MFIDVDRREDDDNDLQQVKFHLEYKLWSCLFN